MATPALLEDTPNFSLALGGPLYKLLWRLHLAGSVPQLLRRQAATSVFFCWVPLAVLSLAQGQFPGGTKLTFLGDIETHVRFLISLPVLILAETVVYQRIRPILKKFVERQVITPEELPNFYAAVNSAVRIQNSVIAEIALLVFVFTAGAWIWKHQIPLDVLSWYASSREGHVYLTMAGYWLAFVSVPVFQFILLRWYMQFLIWFWFLFRVSHIKLHLPALHPDRAAGIGFVGKSTLGFAPLLFAQSALLSGQIAGRIFYNGESLFASKMFIVGFVAFTVVVALVPLCSVMPQLIQAKREGLGRYSAFASRYVLNFDQRWLQGKVNDKQLLGSGDIQSLADLGNSFEIVRGMRLLPISMHDVALLFLVTVAPFLPLLLTIMPLEQLLMRAMKIIF
jgi:hypothetical protein